MFAAGRRNAHAKPLKGLPVLRMNQLAVVHVRSDELTNFICGIAQHLAQTLAVILKVDGIVEVAAVDAAGDLRKGFRCLFELLI